MIAPAAMLGLFELDDKALPPWPPPPSSITAPEAPSSAKLP